MSKISYLLNLLPTGVVMTSRWLTEQGYSPELLKRYRKSGWIESIGNGAMIRKGDRVDYLSALFALQQQLNLSIHPAGKTALSIAGKAHYLELSAESAYLFGSVKESLPAWFINYDWGLKIHYKSTSFLPAETGIQKVEFNNYSLQIPTPARAMMECLYLAPQEQDLVECYELMQGLNNLHPDTVQQLLVQCTSVKVKRLFLYLAEKAGHMWFTRLQTDKIDIGKGKRSITKNGVYIDKYLMTVPKELENNEFEGL